MVSNSMFSTFITSNSSFRRAWIASSICQELSTQRLIANAQEEAKKIIEDARKEADSIVAASRKSADELADNTKSELKLFSGQAVNALKSEIATMVTDKLITASVKDFAQDKDYLNAFIVALASKWSVDEPIVISTADAESLKKYFAAHAKALLDKGVTIEQVNGIKTLFTVSPDRKSVV